MAVFRREQGILHPRRLRELVAPRKGWDRGIKYIRARLQRLPGSPHSIALGFACGVLMSFTPFFGFHILLAMLLAWVMRVSLVASALGTVVGNPLTFPVIITTSIEFGQLLLGREASVAKGTEEYYRTVLQPTELVERWNELLDVLLIPYAVGGMVIGLPLAIAGYLVLRPVVAAYQLARRRLAEKRHLGRKSRRVSAARATPPEAADTVGS